jgi:hypothetical protein
VLPLAWGRAIGAGDHVAGEELGEDLGVEAVGFLDRFGDDAELAGVSQDELISEWLDELEEPLVAGGGLDDGLEVAQRLELGEDVVGLAAVQGAAAGDFAVLVHDAGDDSLLVEVDADVVHGCAPILRARGLLSTSSLPRTQGTCGRRLDFHPPHSFNSRAKQDRSRFDAP